MKGRYNRDMVERSFCVGDKVLVFLPLSRLCLKAQFHGPYEIVKRTSNLNFVVKTPDCSKLRQMCHVNIIKPYYEQGKTNLVVVILHLSPQWSKDELLKEAETLFVLFI